VNRTALLAGMVCLATAASASAQDPFEIQVYQYLTVPKGKWNLETHFNYTARGTTVAEGPVAPTEGQLHLTFELTRGITDYVELAAYLVLARREGHGPEYVGWRLRPRFRLPERWTGPIQVSLSTEVGFPRDRFDTEDVTLEVRPILEWKAGRVQIDLNPVVGRSLKGPGTTDGWDFEPGARVGLRLSRVVDLSAEYYGALGPVKNLDPADQQVHQFFGGADLWFRENVVLNFGVGFGATEAGNRTVLKTRLGWLL